MKVSLVQHTLYLQACLETNQRAIYPGDLTHQFVASEYQFHVFGMGRVEQRISQAPLQPFAFGVGAVRRRKICAEHEKQSKEKYDEGDKHSR